METLKVKAVLSNLTKGGKPCHQLYPKDVNPMSQEDFVKLFAEKIGKDPAEARFINDVHGQVFCQALVQNKVINTGSLRAYLTALGSVTSAGAALNKIDNPIKAVILAHGELKDAVSNILAVNDTKVIEAVLYTVQYGTSAFLNTIEGTGITKANGVGLTITQSNEDEGVWLETLAGVMATDKAAISCNDTNTINFAFSELPEDGEYRLVIATCEGNSKDEFGVTRLERKVSVISAN